MPKKKKKAKIKVLEIYNSWEPKPESFFFELGKRYPKAFILHSNEFGWIVYTSDKEVSIANEAFNGALIEFLMDNPKFNEGQDFTPDDDEETEEF